MSKTIEQTAADAVTERIAELDLGDDIEPSIYNFFAALNTGWLDASNLESILYSLAIRAIKADREQARFLLISEHDDAGVVGLFHTREEAVDAAIANCDLDPDIWDEYYSIQEV